MRTTTTNTTPATQRERIRNIGIAAHIDAGKTTLTERILLASGAIHHAGDVHEGNTTTDFDPLERAKGITISAAAIPCAWTPREETGVAKLFAGQRHALNIIDTPGHVDFTAEVERSMRVLDGAIAVFSGVDGVQPQSETVWRQADRYGVPRLAFVNKMDRTGADFMRVVKQLQTQLGTNAWPVLAPIGAEDELRGQVDVISQRRYIFSRESQQSCTVEEGPSDDDGPAAALRSELVNRIAELDDVVAELWLSDQTVPDEVLRAAVRRQTLAGKFVPVIGGSAYRYVGIEPLLDAVVDFLPSPLDRGTTEALNDEGESISVDNGVDAPLAALAFKLVHDGQSGRLVYVRVYRGVLERGMTVINPRTGQRERIGRMVRVVADRREELSRAEAGDICAVVGLRGFLTGDTLSDLDAIVSLEPPQFPQPVVSFAVEPRTSADRERMSVALQRLAEEDPTFRTYTDAETGQTIMAGMGELHLEVLLTKLARDHRVELNSGAPQVAWRETIERSAEADHLLKKQNGGQGSYARVSLRVEPLPAGSGNRVENRVQGGAIPSQFMRPVHAGIESALEAGVLRDSPVVDVLVTILDGHSHAKDSNDLAFRLAAIEATREALRAARPVLLEPLMAVECTVPEAHQGDILGDLSRRRGQVLGLGMPAQNGVTVVRAEVPLAELFGYADAIRSLSKGRASYTMKPARYERAPLSAIIT
ncbi:elongation factor G [Roseimicrobium sp. ORNL1]|uniref:elongation factor G n=1 Tax=Roseimicrobium sp. ORNL1 TaxID=2711231 RepID=UPI0013E13199|nr:elongation factor G [Roseimicrobium sp. ORNL1]QIF00395.1 elongation factor G [Roseimicrobium sp. ORNL1]